MRIKDLFGKKKAKPILNPDDRWRYDPVDGVTKVPVRDEANTDGD